MISSKIREPKLIWGRCVRDWQILNDIINSHVHGIATTRQDT